MVFPAKGHIDVGMREISKHYITKSEKNIKCQGRASNNYGHQSKNFADNQSPG
jgi:hypothetical protein